MCGIAGVLSKDGFGAAHNLDGLSQAIVYRGRDAKGTWSDGETVSLFHTRLSIIDLATGGQPMQEVSGRFVIVFNGEIYNYQELRRAYEAEGARFQTLSDTEVILEGFRLRGAKICEDLNGMFAFAIWDNHERVLFLARDRVGKKPLFWTQLGSSFYFSSSLDGFRNLPGWTGNLSDSSLAIFNLIGSFPLDRTAYEQASALPPASWMRVTPNRVGRPQTYWRPDFGEKLQEPGAALIQRYEDLLTDAVRIRLRSDVPLALTFSGGVDSGTIAAIAAKKLATPLRCYTIDYHTDADRSEETEIARAVAAHLQLPWEYIHFDYHQSLLSDLKEAYRYYDQPCQLLPLAYSWRLYEAIKPHATVVLSGNGADELFTGYVGQHRTRGADLIRQGLAPALPLLSKFVKSPYLRPSAVAAWREATANRLTSDSGSATVRDDAMACVDEIAAMMHECRAETLLDVQMHLSLFSTNAESNYRLPDISGLHAQVEVRSPFLDFRMIEFAARLPHSWKLRSPFSSPLTKYLPKVYYARHVPGEIAWSRKKGMGYNLKWHLNMAQPSDFRRDIEASYTSLNERGYDASPYRRAFASYVSDIEAGREFSSHAGVVMSGYMFAKWLERSTY